MPDKMLERRELPPPQLKEHDLLWIGADHLVRIDDVVVGFGETVIHYNAKQTIKYPNTTLRVVLRPVEVPTTNPNELRNAWIEGYIAAAMQRFDTVGARARAIAQAAYERMH